MSLPPAPESRGSSFVPARRGQHDTEGVGGPARRRLTQDPQAPALALEASHGMPSPVLLWPSPDLTMNVRESVWRSAARRMRAAASLFKALAPPKVKEGMVEEIK